MITISLNLSGQNYTSKKILTETEIDSLYSRIIELQFLRKENEQLKRLDKLHSKWIQDLQWKVIPLEVKNKNLEKINENNQRIIEEMHKQKNNLNTSNSLEKKKGKRLFFKGILIGVGLELIRELVVSIN